MDHYPLSSDLPLREWAIPLREAAARADVMALVDAWIHPDDLAGPAR